MKKYYHIRGFFKNDPIIIIELNAKTQTINSVFSLNENTLSRHEITNQIFVNEITPIPELEECLLVDRKNEDRILEKLESIYNGLKKKMGKTIKTYTLTEKEYSNVEDQIEDAIEFIKTKGLSLKEKIEYKKQELLAIALELQKIKKTNKKILSKYCILSIITALITVFSIKELIEELPYLLQVLSSTLIATTPFVISTLCVQNKGKEESKTLIEQYGLAQSYLKQYEKELNNLSMSHDKIEQQKFKTKSNDKEKTTTLSPERKKIYLEFIKEELEKMQQEYESQKKYQQVLTTQEIYGNQQKLLEQAQLPNVSSKEWLKKEICEVPHEPVKEIGTRQKRFISKK